MGIGDQASAQRLPVGADEAWRSLKLVGSRVGKIVETDEFLKRMVISTGMSAFSWGEKMAVQVQDEGEGRCSIVIESALKVGVNVMGAGRNRKNIDALLSELSRDLQRRHSR
jgi:hypothetical protein